MNNKKCKYNQLSANGKIKKFNEKKKNEYLFRVYINL